MRRCPFSTKTTEKKLVDMDKHSGNKTEEPGERSEGTAGGEEAPSDQAGGTQPPAADVIANGPMTPSTDSEDLDEECCVEVTGVGDNTSMDSVTLFFESPKRSGGGKIRHIDYDQTGGKYTITFQSKEAVDGVIKNTPMLLDGSNLAVTELKTKETTGVGQEKVDSKKKLKGDINESEHPNSPTSTFPRDIIIADIDENKKAFLKTMKMFRKTFDAEVDWEHGVDSELHLVCTSVLSSREEWIAWRERVEESIRTLLDDLVVEKRCCIQSCWKDSCAEAEKLRRNQTVAIVDRPEELSLLVVGRQRAVEEVYQLLDEACKDVVAQMDRVTEEFELEDYEVKIIQKANLIPTLKRKYNHVRITLTDELMVLDGPAIDLQNIKNFVNIFLRKLVKRIIPLSAGEINVFRMLRRQLTHEFNSFLANLRILIQIDGNSISIYGPPEDLDEFEDVLANTISEHSLEVPQEEKNAFKEDIWEEFQNHMFVKYTGLIHLEVDDATSQVNIAGMNDDFTSIVDQVQKYIQTKSRREIPIPLNYFEAKMVLQWMKLETKYPRTTQADDGETVSIQVTSRDYPQVYQDLDSFIRKTETRNLTLHQGHHRVFSVLKNQRNSSLSKSLNKLRVLILDDKPHLTLFGITDDLEKFEKLIFENIKDATVQISPEEKTALEEANWREFEAGLVLKYSGVVHLMIEDNRSSVRFSTHSDYLEELIEDVKGYKMRNAIRTFVLNLEPLEIKKIIEWAKVEELFPSVKISVVGKGISLKGPPEHSLLASTQMHAFLTSVTRKSINLSRGTAKVLNMRQINDSFREGLSSLNLKWQLDGQIVRIMGVVRDVQAFEELLGKQIKESTLALSDEETAGFEHKEWAEWSRSLTLKYRAVVHVENVDNKISLNVASPGAIHEDVVIEVMDFIQSNALTKVSMDWEAQRVKQVIEWMKIDDKYPQVTISYDEDTLVLKGRVTDSTELAKEVLSFLESVDEKTFDISQGQMKVFSSMSRQKDHPMKQFLDSLKIQLDFDDNSLTLFGVSEDMSQCIEMLNNNIMETTIEVLTEQLPALEELVWRDFSNVIHTRHAGQLHLEAAEDKSTVNLVAPASDFNHILDQLREHVDRNTVKKVSLNLEEDLIRKMLKWFRIEERNQELKVKLLDGAVILTGRLTVLEQVEKELADFIKGTDTCQLNLRKGVMKILEMMLNQPNSKFTRLIEKLSLDIVIDEDKAFVFGVKKDFGMLDELIAHNIQEAEFKISEEELAAFSENIWDEFYGALIVRCSGMLQMELNEDGTVVNMTTATPKFYGTLDELKKFIKKNAIRKTIVNLDANHRKLMEQRMKVDLMDIMDDLKKHRVRLVPDRRGFVVHGTEDGLELAGRSILRLKRRIITGGQDIDAPGMPFYFTQDEGRVLIRELQEKYQTVVQLEGPSGEVIGGEAEDVADADETDEQSDDERDEISEDSQTTARGSDTSPPCPPAVTDEGGEIQIGPVTLQVVPGDVSQETTDGTINLTKARVEMTPGAVWQTLAGQNTDHQLPDNEMAGIEVLCSKEEWQEGLMEGLTNAERAQWSSLSVAADNTGYPKPEELIVAAMNAIADFCGNNSRTKTLSLVRIVVGERYMVPAYLERIETEISPAGKLHEIITSPIRYFGNKTNEYVRDKVNSRLRFTVVGLTKKDVESVKREIRKRCRQESADTCVSGMGYSDTIHTLNTNQIEALSILCRRLGVRMTVTADKDEANTAIRLQGLTRDVREADKRVKKVLNDIKDRYEEQQLKAMAEQLAALESELPNKKEAAVDSAKLVIWEYNNSNSRYHPYPAEINNQLEKAHNAGDHFMEWMEDKADGKVMKWKTDLKAKTETDGTTRREIRRREFTLHGPSLETPDSWTTPAASGENDLVLLDPTGDEFKSVAKDFRDTSENQIIKIERLQNKYLYRRYAVHKENMKTSQPGETNIERRLWHGTTANSMDKIKSNGFNRSYCTHSVELGQGVYFTTTARDATGAAQPDAAGLCRAYYARVNTGRSAPGDQSIRSPPVISYSNPPQTYDSTVDKVDDPKTYVIYYDTQAYPEYLVTFELSEAHRLY